MSREEQLVNNSGEQPDEEEYIQRRLLQTARDLLEELHVTKGSWDRKILEKYVMEPLETLLDKKEKEREEEEERLANEEENGGSGDEDDRNDGSRNQSRNSNNNRSAAFSNDDNDNGAKAAAEAAHDYEVDRQNKRNTADRKLLISEMRKERQQQQAMVEQIVKLVNCLAHHKEETLNVLQSVVRRREAYDKLLALEGANLDEAELQTHVLSACYHLRNATLKVVETIATWRTGLTMAHPFMFEQKNYLFTIMAEMKSVSELPNISASVALEFVRFPLFSNMPSLSLFSGDPAKLSGPSNRSKYGGAPPVDAKLMARLLHAEEYLHQEPERQANMVLHLMELCQRGKFVPTLDISCVYPGLYAKPKAGGGGAAKGGGGARSKSAAGGRNGGGGAAGGSRGKLVGIEVRSGAELEKLRTVLMGSLEQLKATPST